MVWSKTNGGQGSLWRSQHELLPIFKKGRASHVNNVELGRWGRWRSNVWVYPGGSSLGSDSRDGLSLHPTVKPRALLEDALLDVTNRDEVVLDPFLGSGSTLLAAESTGRICRAVEIDGPYCDVAIRRWQDLTGEQAVLEATGQTFGEVARERFGDPRRGACHRTTAHGRIGRSWPRRGGPVMSDGSNPKPAKPGGGYAVGYGKPPKVNQFKPGKSGNPNGRPKGQPTTQQLLLQEGAKLVKVKVGDEIIQIPKQQAVVRKLYLMAMEGNIVAVRLTLALTGSAELAEANGQLEPPLTEEELQLAKALGLKPGGGSHG